MLESSQKPNGRTRQPRCRQGNSGGWVVVLEQGRRRPPQWEGQRIEGDTQVQGSHIQVQGIQVQGIQDEEEKQQNRRQLDIQWVGIQQDKQNELRRVEDKVGDNLHGKDSSCPLSSSVFDLAHRGNFFFVFIVLLIYGLVACHHSGEQVESFGAYCFSDQHGSHRIKVTAIGFGEAQRRIFLLGMKHIPWIEHC